MKSTDRPALPSAAGVYRLRSAGVADPCAPAGTGAPTDLLVALGEVSRRAGAWSRTILVLASGGPGEVWGDSAAGAPAVDLTGSVLLPGMVNAHTHLDLTHLGPRKHDAAEGFVSWVERVRSGRAERADAIRASVERGVDLSLRAGVVLVGDIAGAPGGRPRIEPFEVLADSPLGGVSFVESFAMGTGEPAALERLEAFLVRMTAHRSPLPVEDSAHEGGLPTRGGARLGLQPHAPNTVSLPAYRRAVEVAHRRGLPLATHLAETPEEREFIARGTGPQREMLERFGVWDDRVLEHIGRGGTPVEHLAGVLAAAERAGSPFLAAHINDLGPDAGRALEVLERTRTSVAYCPRSSEYFGAASHFGPHRYRDMLAAGINVCLGTDSIVCLPRGVDEPAGSGLSVLDEARLLFRRDGTDADTLVRMMTVNGCLGLGLPESVCSLGEGAAPGGLVAVPVEGGEDGRSPAARVLASAGRPALLAVAPS